MFLLFIAL